MLKLAASLDQVRVPLGGDAFVILDPITPAMRRRALRAVKAFMERAGIADFAAASVDQQEDVGEVISRELIRMGAREWGGVGSADGVAIDLTPDQATRLDSATDPDRPTGTIDLLLADMDEFQKLDAGYVRPDTIRRAEKNASSPSPNGTSAAATPGKGTANSRAGRKKTAAAKSARTKPRRSRPRPAKPSGKS